MAIEKVRTYLEQFSASEKIMEFPVSSATVELAAKALGCEPCRIAKSVSLDLNGRPIIIVTAGDAKIDNAKYKRVFGAKAKMLRFEDVEALTGHPAGGVCPFAVNENTEVLLDVSLKRFKTVFPACGSANSAIELTLEELEKFSSNFKGWTDVCKLPEC